MFWLAVFCACCAMLSFFFFFFFFLSCRSDGAAANDRAVNLSSPPSWGLGAPRSLNRFFSTLNKMWRHKCLLHGAKAADMRCLLHLSTWDCSCKHRPRCCHTKNIPGGGRLTRRTPSAPFAQSVFDGFFAEDTTVESAAVCSARRVVPRCSLLRLLEVARIRTYSAPLQLVRGRKAAPRESGHLRFPPLSTRLHHQL